MPEKDTSRRFEIHSRFIVANVRQKNDTFPVHLCFTLEFLLPTNYPRESATSFCSPHLPTWVESTRMACGYTGSKRTPLVSLGFDFSPRFIEEARSRVFWFLAPGFSSWLPVIGIHWMIQQVSMKQTKFNCQDYGTVHKFGSTLYL